jgi:hypothetical protein
VRPARNTRAPPFTRECAGDSTPDRDGTTVDHHREAVGDHEPLSLILGTMLDTDVGLAEEFSERENALDPAIPLVWLEGCYWTVHLGESSSSYTTTQRPVERGRSTW